MRVVEGPWTPEPLPRPTVLTFGKFDAQHLGHQAIFEEVVDQARTTGAESAVFFLDPHPLKVLDPRRCPPTLTALPKKLELLESFGIDVAIVGRFDDRLRTTEPDAFLRHLVEHFRARSLVVGHSVRFGHRGTGDMQLLRRAARELGFDLTVVPARTLDGEPISSTRIRAAIGTGDLRLAARLLGRYYSVTGEVVAGEKRGKTIGFPTANVTYGDQQLPPLGIYAGQTMVAGRAYASAISLGIRPTFPHTGVWLESYLLDFEGDLYGRQIEVAFAHKLRDEERFTGLPALQAQIQADIDEVRRLLGPTSAAEASDAGTQRP